MVVFPEAKINLGLHVLRKRKDGYHDIETCFYPVPLTDVLEAVPSEEFDFTQTGLPIPGSMEDNLCVKAYKLIRENFKIDPVHIHLHKIIPMGAGLGGGSSDGAYMLKLLNALFNLNITPGELKAMAAQLGSDCSFFIDAVPTIGTGTGTSLQPANLSLTNTFIRILHPGIHINTADAYGGLTPNEHRDSLVATLESPYPEWPEKLKNDFCISVYSQQPKIGHLEELLYEQGAFYACMSGSGSAVFGLFEDAPPSMDFEGFEWTGRLT